jgi:hypothetical protein
MKARLAILTLALLASCGGGSDPKALTSEGYSALQGGRYEEAAGHFDAALAALGTDTASADYKKAKMGSVEALVHTDAAKARDEFLAYAKGNPSRVDDRDFNKIGGLFGSAGKVKEGVAVLSAGMEAFPESPHLQALVQQLGDLAKKSNAEGDMEALKGLGYVGD